MASWRYIVGHGGNLLRHAVMRHAPALRIFPHDNWLYDLRRFGGVRLGPIFDVGANIGQTAWGLTRYFPKDPIYCFEPVEATFRVLQARYARKVSCINAALGSTPGVSTINTFENSELNTLSRPGKLASSGVGSIQQVMVDTVDAFAARAGIASLGLLKMDVQGWELEVLKGATTLLTAGKIRFVFAEVGFDPEDEDTIQFGALEEALVPFGYKFAGLYDSFRYGPNKQHVGFSSALYALA